MFGLQLNKRQMDSVTEESLPKSDFLTHTALSPIHLQGKGKGPYMKCQLKQSFQVSVRYPWRSCPFTSLFFRLNWIYTLLFVYLFNKYLLYTHNVPRAESK